MMRKLRYAIIAIVIFSLSPVLESCTSKYPGSKALEKRKRKLRRKYKRNGINDCPVFDCRMIENSRKESV